MIQVRPAADADLVAILAIYNHAIATTTAVFEYEPHSLQVQRDWLDAKRTASFPVLVADLDDVVVGFATYGPFRMRPAYKYTVEHSVYVAEGVRRRGVARQLMQALIADARTRDYHAVVGGIVADNLPSLRLHESLGFVEVGHFPEVGYKFGRWQDLKFLQLLLDTPRAPTAP